MPFAQAASQLDSLLSSFSGAVVLLSGGADSVFLCHVLSAWSKAKAYPIAALHVNYGLRGDNSDMDESFVRQLCEDINIPLEVHTANSDDLNHGNLQQKARNLRRNLAETLFPQNWALLTGHHAADQAENLIAGLLTRSTPYGISLIQRRSGRWVHPLLDLHPQDMRRALKTAGKSWREDLSNRDSQYQRNWIRHQLLEPLGQNAPNEMPVLLERISHSISSLQEDHRRAIENCLKILSFQDDPHWMSLERSGFNRYFLDLQLGLVENLGKTCGAWFRLPSLRFRKSLCHQIAQGRPGAILPLGNGYQISLGRQRAFWHRSELSVPASQCIQMHECLTLGTKRFTFGSMPLTDLPSVFHSWKSASADEAVEIRTWEQGDRMRIAKDKHALISDIFSQAGCALPEKKLWPLVTIAGEPHWLPGLRHAWSQEHESERNNIIWMDE
jgi:tRNA(Ile)-lysidine synthetase-like protein